MDLIDADTLQPPRDTVERFTAELSRHANWTDAIILYCDGKAIAIVGASEDGMVTICSHLPVRANRIRNTLLKLACAISEERFIIVRNG